MGDEAAGLARLDEVMLAGDLGDVGPIVSGTVYCAVILECMQLYDLARAAGVDGCAGRVVPTRNLIWSRTVVSAWCTSPSSDRWPATGRVQRPQWGTREAA